MELPGHVPSPDALQGLLDDLNKAMAGLPDTHRRLMALTGVAWSDDRTVKVEVGPRGQLVDLEIDPRVFRTPDAQALRASILSASQAAVSHLAGQIEEIVGSQVPPEVAELRAQYQPDAIDPMSELLMSDAEIVRQHRGQR